MQSVVSQGIQRTLVQKRTGDNSAAPFGDTSATTRPLLMNGLRAFGVAEIAEVAYVNWERDGCPAGRGLQYWLEAESQLKSTWHFLVAACDASVAAEVLAEVRLTDLALAFCEKPL